MAGFNNLYKGVADRLLKIEKPYSELKRAEDNKPARPVDSSDADDEDTQFAGSSCGRELV